jgi:hypothetical protein
MELTTSPFEMLIEYLAEKATPEEILAFKLPEHIQDRAHELLDANSAGTLTIEQRAELDEFMQFDRFMMRLKAKAYRGMPEK